MTVQDDKGFIPILDLSSEVETLRSELRAAFDRVLDSGQFIMGPEVSAFEQEVAAYLGTKHAIGVNSGTDALVIGLRALGIGAGDEVITTPFTFFATAESISTVGATPVFVDVDARNYNIDASQVEAAITPRTKAIMPVHLYGNPCDMRSLLDVAERHGLYVIEDCAQSFGACYHRDGDSMSGRQTGTLGTMGAYSFFPSKNLGAYGDGGLIVTNDDQLAEQARMLRLHGAKKKYHNEILGYNSRLDAMQAAILRVKLPHIDIWNEQRRAVAQRYNELLANVSEVETPEITPGHVFHQYTIRLLEADRDEVQRRLKQEGIGTMVYYPVPQDRLPIYAGQYPRNPISDDLAKQVLSLPIWPSIAEDIQHRVASALKASVRHA